MQNSKPFNKTVKVLVSVFVAANLLFFCFKIWELHVLKDFNAAQAAKIRNADFADLQLKTLPYNKLNMSNGKKVVLRLIRNDCQECVDSIFNNTIKLAKKLGKDSVIVLISGDYSETEYLTLKRLYQFNFNLYQVSDKITVYDSQVSSYYFVFNIGKPQIAQKAYRLYTKVDAGHTPLYNKWLAMIN